MSEGAWPKCRYGPGGQSAIFERPEDVPEGWEDHPNKVKEDEPEPKAPPKARKKAK